MVIDYVLFALGIIFLLKGADWIVDSASSIAKRHGVSQLIIGLTIVAFGTSLPELVVNIFAALSGSSEVAFGNVIGSNIANILLVLGLTAITGSIHVRASTVWKEVPFAILSAFILLVLVNKSILGVNSTQDLSVFDSFILLSMFAFFMFYIIQVSLRERAKVTLAEKPQSLNWKIYPKLIIGLIGIYFGGEWIVSGAGSLASSWGMSEFFISATIVAVGTSLPELVVCLIAAYKKNVDLAVGNIIGSNIFNTLWVLGIVPLISPLTIPQFMWFDLLVMVFSTILLFIILYIGRHEIRRKDGILLFLLYVIYVAVILNRG